MSMICDKRQSFPVLCVRDGQKPLRLSMWHPFSILNNDDLGREERKTGYIGYGGETRARLCHQMNINPYFSFLSSFL